MTETPVQGTLVPEINRGRSTESPPVLFDSTKKKVIIGVSALGLVLCLIALCFLWCACFTRAGPCASLRHQMAATEINTMSMATTIKCSTDSRLTFHYKGATDDATHSPNSTIKTRFSSNENSVMLNHKNDWSLQANQGSHSTNPLSSPR